MKKIKHITAFILSIFTFSVLSCEDVFEFSWPSVNFNGGSPSSSTPYSSTPYLSVDSLVRDTLSDYIMWMHISYDSMLYVVDFSLNYWENATNVTHSEAIRLTLQDTIDFRNNPVLVHSERLKGLKDSTTYMFCPNLWRALNSDTVMVFSSCGHMSTDP